MRKLIYFILPLILGIIIASCEKDDTSIIDPILNFAVIDSVVINPQQFDTSRVVLNLTAYITSVDPISSVSAQIKNPDGTVIKSIVLNGSGNVYTGVYDTLQSCRYVGNYSVEFIAVTSEGLPSNTVSGNFNVINTQNIKPIVSLVYAPDSLQRPTGGDLVPSFLQVQVSDPNGECDIAAAYFNATNPNGVPNPSNPFTMYDNGNPVPPFCDTVANDGKYSLMIYIGSTATLGDYSFKFNTRDRSAAVSDTVLKIINVHP